MAAAAPSLRRLLGPEVRQVLDDMAAAMPGLELAVVDPAGEVAYSSVDRLDRPRYIDLAPRGELLGRLAVAGEVPGLLLDGVARTISLHLRNALDTQDLARETLERYREINVLYRASETIGACLDTAMVPHLLLLESERVIPAGAGVVLLGHGDDWRTGARRGDGDGLASAATQLIASVADTRRPDIGTWDGATDSALAVPILAAGTLLGLVVLGRTPSERAFTAGDEKLLLGLAGQAGIAIERARLHEQETRRQRLEEELAVARRIQLTLLPAHVPVVRGWSFAATYQAAREVGGDFYDFIPPAQGEPRLGIVIADVTGKGVPAALMMAYARAVLRAESAAGRSPVEVLERANRLIMQERQQRLFLSAFYAELDFESGRLAYANAGHDAPLLVEGATGAVRELDAPGVVLGAFSGMGLEAREVALGPGDRVVFYTDGVTEARDRDGRLFGDQRLRAAATAADGGAETTLTSIADAVARFTAGAPQADDLTLVIVERTVSTIP